MAVLKNIAFVVLLVGSGFSSTNVDWAGGTGSWTDPLTNHWGLGIGVYPGDMSHGTEYNARILRSSDVVTLNNALSRRAGSIQVHRGTLNIQADLLGTSAAFGQFGTGAIINHTEGSYNASFTISLGQSTNSGEAATYNLCGGSLTNTGGYGLLLGQLGTNGHATFNLSGGSLDIKGGVIDNGTLNISGGSFNSSESFTMNAHVNLRPELNIVGTNANNITFNSLDARNAGGAVLGFRLVAQGVDGITVVSNLTLTSVGIGSILEIDATDWDGVSGLTNRNAFVLVDYGYLDGKFASTNLINIAGTIDYTYDLGGGRRGIAFILNDPDAVIGTGRVTAMPNMPEPYNMRDWDTVVIDYYDFIFDPDISGPGLPVFKWTNGMYRIKSYVGDDQIPGYGLPMNTLGALLGATVAGNDMTSYSDTWTNPASYSANDFVTAANNCYWRTNIGMFGPSCLKTNGAESTQGTVKYFRIFGVWPCMLMQLVPYFYPGVSGLTDRVIADLGQWYNACVVMSTSGPGGTADFSYDGFDFNPASFMPVASNNIDYVQLRAGLPEMGNGAALGWMMYLGWNITGDTNYLTQAEKAINWQLEDRNIEWFGREELDHMGGPLAVARLNSELGYNFSLDDMLCIWFGDYNPQAKYGNWEVIYGSSFDINGTNYTCDGIQGWDGFYPTNLVLGKVNGYTNGFWSYAGGTLMGPSWLMPVARYYPSYARDIGKYALNAANTAAFYQGYGLDWDHQDHKDWKDAYDPSYLLFYEDLTSAIWGQSPDEFGPYATGDRISTKGWSTRSVFPLSDYLVKKGSSDTNIAFTGVGDNLALYQGNYIGFLGGIFKKTNIEGIIQWDCLKTDYYHLPAYDTYLYYNPYNFCKTVSIDVGTEPKKLYDAVTKRIVRSNVTGITTFNMLPDSAAVIVVVPNSASITTNNGKLEAGGIIIDFNPYM